MTDFARFRRRFAELGGSLRENLVVFESVTSTNEVARAIVGALPLEAYPPLPTLIVAWEQTRGRGRLDRGWRSPPGGGLYCTLLWALDGRQAPPLLPLAVAVAVCDGVERTGVACRLKWPNDLLLDGRKLGGILIEVTAPAASVPATAIIGFGVNLSDADGGMAALGGVAIGCRDGREVAAAELLVLLAPSLRRLGRLLA
jgi:BirA family biotin operon repressor/biotin-[acetyl-CoA-carboxylase] ligase